MYPQEYLEVHFLFSEQPKRRFFFVCLVFAECIIPFPDTMKPEDINDAMIHFNRNYDGGFVMTNDGIRTTEA